MIDQKLTDENGAIRERMAEAWDEAIREAEWRDKITPFDGDRLREDNPYRVTPPGGESDD